MGYEEKKKNPHKGNKQAQGQAKWQL